MSSASLAVGAALLLGVAGVLAHVGLRVGARAADGPGAGALRALALWWYAFAAANALAGMLVLLTALGVVVDARGAAAAAHASAAAHVVAFYGILHYLLYLYTGRPGVGRVVAWTLAAYGVALAAAVHLARPVGLVAGSMHVSLAYDGPQAPIGMLMLPLALAPLVLAGAYARLYRTTADRSRRYRIALVSLSVFALFAFGLVAAAAGLVNHDAAQLALRGVSLFAALGVLAAYEPPAPLRRRYGLHAFHDEAHAPPEREEERRARAAQLARRVQDLI